MPLDLPPAHLHALALAAHNPGLQAARRGDLSVVYGALPSGPTVLHCSDTGELSAYVPGGSRALAPGRPPQDLRVPFPLSREGSGPGADLYARLTQVAPGSYWWPDDLPTESRRGRARKAAADARPGHERMHLRPGPAQPQGLSGPAHTEAAMLYTHALAGLLPSPLAAPVLVTGYAAYRPHPQVPGLLVWRRASWVEGGDGERLDPGGAAAQHYFGAALDPGAEAEAFVAQHLGRQAKHAPVAV